MDQNNSQTLTRPWMDASLSPGNRARLLLQAMNPGEKVGQLMQLDGRGDLEEMLGQMGVGSLLHINGQGADRAIDRALQTRLGIPVLLADDGIHGHSFWAGATIFPTQLAMACSWDPALVQAAARVTAREMRATGLKWTFSPVLCLTRDLRWGRVGETFGEDPWLIGVLAKAMIAGYQGQGLDDPEAVLATAKHYAGYSETLGGRDASEADISQRKLRSWFLPPFEEAARSGCMAFMTGYQSMDGIPSTANSWLLKGVLRNEWNFEGILVTDWNNVGNLVSDQKICNDLVEASALAVKSGNDMMMATPGFHAGCLAALERGLLTMAELDEVVLRILTLKFRLGLFENPGRSDPGAIARVIACESHRQVNLDLTRKCPVLLQNNGILPFDLGAGQARGDGTPRRLLVLGPNAHDPLSQLGDWSLGSGQTEGSSSPLHPRSQIVTLVDGLRQVCGPDWELDWLPACSMHRPGLESPDLVRRACESADLVILALGDCLDFVGEYKSTATLELPGGQRQLADLVARASRAAGVGVVGVLINSKPLVLPESVLGFDALIEAFNPGMAGGRALAEIIAGLTEPQGHLTVSIPRHVGQQPVYYNQVRGQHGNRYADLDQRPAFVFGHGLSWTEFVVESLDLVSAPARLGDKNIPVTLRAWLRNTGSRPGTALVQVYVEDLVTSLTWAGQELKAFGTLKLKPGEVDSLTLEIALGDLAIMGKRGVREVEAGDFRFHCGFSSAPEGRLSLDLHLDP